MDHICALVCGSDRILRNISLDIAQCQIVACIQHAAVSISASLNQVILALLCCGNKHFRPVKMFCQQSLGNLRSEVSKIYNQRITAGCLDVLKCLHHMDLTLYDT